MGEQADGGVGTADVELQSRSPFERPEESSRAAPGSESSRGAGEPPGPEMSSQAATASESTRDRPEASSRNAAGPFASSAGASRASPEVERPPAIPEAPRSACACERSESETFAPGSRARLNRRALERFPGESLFARLARTVCEAECLPRKELYEAWEVARRVRRRIRGRRVVDLAAGHGLLAYAMLLLDDTSPEAVCVDRRRPPSAARLAAVLEERWPRLRGRVSWREQDLSRFQVDSEDLLVSAHACGRLTDEILRLAIDSGAPVAVLPCCQHLAASELGGLEGWLDGPLAIDVVRAQRLRAAGYQISTQTIPASITPKNRLLIASP